MDLLKTFGPLLGSIAPSIATALGGPLAGLATKALSQALLGTEDSTEADQWSKCSSSRYKRLCVGSSYSRSGKRKCSRRRAIQHRTLGKGDLTRRA